MKKIKQLVLSVTVVILLVSLSACGYRPPTTAEELHIMQKAERLKKTRRGDLVAWKRDEGHKGIFVVRGTSSRGMTYCESVGACVGGGVTLDLTASIEKLSPNLRMIEYVCGDPGVPTREACAVQFVEQ